MGNGVLHGWKEMYLQRHFGQELSQNIWTLHILKLHMQVILRLSFILI